LVIECSHCKTRYNYDEERFAGKPSKKIRCARCKEVFEIANPAFAKPAQKKVSSTDDTAVRSAPSWIKKEKEKEAENAGIELPADTAPIDQPLGLPSGKRLSIAIIEGPETPKVFRIEKPEVILGRSNVDIVLNDTESSREHARIEVRGNAVFLRDLDSRNGTWLNGKKIEEPVEIQNQTEFQIGGSTLMLIVTEGD